MSERETRTDARTDTPTEPATRMNGAPAGDEDQQPWLLTQETPGLDPAPIREAAGPDWGDDRSDGKGGDGETIDEADVETGPTSEQTDPSRR